MLRRVVLLLAAGAMARPVRAESTWALIDEADARRDRAVGRQGATRGITVPGGPVIAVDKPATEQGLPKPFSFRIRFMPPADAAIDVSTFRASYGWLGIDITTRLLEHARLTAQGLSADDIDAPSGEHRVTIGIADTLGRKGSRTFRFTIA